VRVRLDLTQIVLHEGDGGPAVDIAFNLVLITADRETVVAAQPAENVFVKPETRMLFTRAIEALTRDLSVGIGLQREDDLLSDEDFLDDTEIQDAHNEEAL
jgi:hypothetical protein